MLLSDVFFSVVVIRVTIVLLVNMSSKCLVVCLVLLARHFGTRHQTLFMQTLDTFKQTLDTMRQTLGNFRQTLDTFKKTLDTFKQILDTRHFQLLLDTFKYIQDTFEQTQDIFNQTLDAFPYSINLLDIYQTFTILSIIFGYFLSKNKKIGK